MALLEVEKLSIGFPTASGEVPVVREVSFSIEPGESVGLVGESGSGKSLTALSILGLVPPPGRILGGAVRFAGRNLVGASERELRAVRGGGIGLVFQEPGAALNPVLNVGAQLIEAIRAHRPLARRAARDRAVELLDRVSIPEPGRRLAAYPHELSGGQRQRVVLAIALAGEPKLLIADEPTTALDVTLQAQVLALLDRLRRELGLALLLITHDLAVVAQACARVLVLYAGELVESSPATLLYAEPAHPYTRGLLASLPRLGHPAPRGHLPSIAGQVPAPAERPTGCAFHPRCALRRAECSLRPPPWVEIGDERGVRCVLYADGEGGVVPAA